MNNGEQRGMIHSFFKAFTTWIHDLGTWISQSDLSTDVCQSPGTPLLLLAQETQWEESPWCDWNYGECRGPGALRSGVFNSLVALGTSTHLHGDRGSCGTEKHLSQFGGRGYSEPWKTGGEKQIGPCETINIGICKAVALIWVRLYLVLLSQYGWKIWDSTPWLGF